ncbi:MAG TPA: tRNA (adenosine(37)-N6)-threonylcarbamoyltransferase complex dimerization subunit type 1 TsaB [Candidatus Saccharimonadales bacterium]|jgi:tRNA threonylcarbamoyladenosine biosynthesis protein TsaB
MNILALDTSTAACSVALLARNEIKTIQQIGLMQQGQLVLPAMESLLTTAALTLADLDAIAYGCGPGSFTGLRIASSVVQALGVAQQLPIIRVSSMAALAQAAAMHRPATRRVLVALDARMEQIYWAVYQVNTHGDVELIGQEQVSAPEELPHIEQIDCGVGDGWSRYDAQLQNKLSTSPQLLIGTELPIAPALIKLATLKFAQHDWIKPADAVPTYLR